MIETNDNATLQRWSGLIELLLIFAAVAAWESNRAITIVVLLVFLLRRWGLAGEGVLILLQLERAPVWLIWLLPSTAGIARQPITSSRSTSDEPEPPIASDVAPGVQEALHGVAMPTTPDNDALRVALERAQIATIATLIMESQSKAFQNGVLPETRALTSVFKVSVSSSTTSEYQRLRQLLKIELEQRAKPQQKAKNDDIIGILAGRVVRKAADDSIYFVNSDGSREEMQPTTTIEQSVQPA